VLIKVKMATEPTTESLTFSVEGGRDPKVPVRWWHWLMGVGLVFLLTFLAPRGKSPEFAYLTDGSISREKIIAPFDFEVLKSANEMKKERREAADKVLPVMTTVDSVKEVFSRRLLSFGGESEAFLSKLPSSVFQTIVKGAEELSPGDSLLLIAGNDKLFNRFGFRLSIVSWKFLIRLYYLDMRGKSGTYQRFFERSLGGILLNIYNQGVINVPRDQLSHPAGSVVIRQPTEEIPTNIKELLTINDAMGQISSMLRVWLNEKALPKGALSAAYEILQQFVAANLIFDEKETVRRSEAAISKVPLAKGVVKKDELIIDANIKVTQDHLDKLNSLAIKRIELERERGSVRALMQIGGQFLLSALVILMLWTFMAVVRTKIWLQWKLVLLVALVLTLMHLFQAFVPVKYALPRFIFPAAIGAMLLAILVDRSVAMAGVVAMALLAGFLRGNDFPVALCTVLVGATALFAVKRVQTRGHVMRTALYLLAVYIAIVAVFHAVRFTTGAPLLTDIWVASANAIISPSLVLGLIIICESVFGITTDLSLLELVDLNRPLLRELAIKSPGTYHHSIMVGSLAEAAAREINANSLLTRAGAYYHDIGKMLNKDYFIENQEMGSRNIHDRLPPEKSAEVVIGHVWRGLELAEKYRLPIQVKNFISEHHGQSKLAFFLDKAIKESGEDVDEAKYHYPGPKPQSKETGVVMLADTVEAATRSMDDQTPEMLHDTVGDLIRLRLSEGDLDECPLTLREIGMIRKAFIQVLTGIYHQRIPYPDQKNEEEGADASIGEVKEKPGMIAEHGDGSDAG